MNRLQPPQWLGSVWMLTPQLLCPQLWYGSMQPRDLQSGGSAPGVHSHAMRGSPQMDAQSPASPTPPSLPPLELPIPEVPVLEEPPPPEEDDDATAWVTHTPRWASQL